jgi:hypothetical protein
MGTLENISNIWYNPASIANILSLEQVRRVRQVTMDTNTDPAFYVHKSDGGPTIFAEHSSGLYLHKVSDSTANQYSPVVTAHSYLQTVAQNKQNFTICQVEAAHASRKLYNMLGRPSIPCFLHAVCENQLLNCPITADDIKRAKLIYGKDMAFLKGKTTSNPTKEHLPDHLTVPLPPDLVSLHKNVTLCFNIFYVLNLTFLISTSRNIHYLSCRHLPNRTNLPT